MKTNYWRNAPGLGSKHNISRTPERNIVRDVSKKPWKSAKMTVDDLAIVVGFSSIVPEELLYSRSGSSKPD